MLRTYDEFYRYHKDHPKYKKRHRNNQREIEFIKGTLDLNNS